LSGANQYSVKPLALVRNRNNRRSWRFFRVTPEPSVLAGSPPPPVAWPARWPNKTRAATEMAPTAPTTSETRGPHPGQHPGVAGRAGSAGLPRAPAIATTSASVAKARHLDQASGDPPPSFRISLYPNSPDPDRQ